MNIDKKRVLFICMQNAARSQMAEALLKQIAGDRFDVQSAGLELAPLNRWAIEALRQVGTDISGNRTQSAFDLYKNGQLFDYVISLFDEASAERCPVFPGVTTRLDWNFPDPSSFRGTPEELLAQTVRLRDALRDRIQTWVTKEEGPALFGRSA